MTTSSHRMRYGASPRAVRRWLLAGLTALLLLLPVTALAAAHGPGPAREDGGAAMVR